MCMELLFDLLHTGRNVRLRLQAVLSRQKPRQHFLQGTLVGFQPQGTQLLLRTFHKDREVRLRDLRDQNAKKVEKKNLCRGM